MISQVYAQGTLATTTVAATTGAPATGGLTQNPLISLVIWVILFGAIMYFFMIMPQKRREKKSKEMLTAMEVNDMVTTIGGMTGKIVGMQDDEVTIESGIDKAKVAYKKWAIKEIRKPGAEN